MSEVGRCYEYPFEKKDNEKWKGGREERKEGEREGGEKEGGRDIEKGRDGERKRE